MRVELTRFRVRLRRAERADEWLRMLNERLPESFATRERAKVEVRGERGDSFFTMPRAVDRRHLERLRVCTDLGIDAMDAIPRAAMVRHLAVDARERGAGPPRDVRPRRPAQAPELPEYALGHEARDALPSQNARRRVRAGADWPAKGLRPLQAHSAIWRRMLCRDR
jgi:hypothetical protein